MQTLQCSKKMINLKKGYNLYLIIINNQNNLENVIKFRNLYILNGYNL